MSQATTCAGLDVHKKEIAVCLLRGGSQEPREWTVPHTKASVSRLLRRLEREGGSDVVCAYEAGPCGYALARRFEAAGLRCQVVAPSLVPVRPGQRIKTDQRDARKLAEMLQGGLLVEVHPPSEQEESVRDLCRCREDLKQNLLRARHRLAKMLLRRGLDYREGKHWTLRHRSWLRKLRFEHEVDHFVFGEYLAGVEILEARLFAVEQKLTEVSESEPWAERIGWLRCFRGIDTVTAMTIVAELHDFRRFHSPRQLMSYLGLVPREHSSGESQHRGGLTKAGNSHVRRVLIEAAWHYRHRPAVGVRLRQRRRGQPASMIALADRAQQRLYARYGRLVLGRRKPPTKAVAAMARELAGFVWAALYLYPQQRAMETR